ncbi:MAG TPA: serine hydrolase domain-containing protein [Pyrinomonadaceae bacterium]|nr:serine hydrolase domain-containing protein [Pyrinomonadaceae bacterium]
MKSKVILVFLLTLGFFAGALSQAPNEAKLDQFFDRLAEKNKAMGSLVIAREGKVVYERAIGYSHITPSDKKPITAATRFRIGSITKMFTAAMVLKLADEKRLRPSDTIDKYFPRIPNAKNVTIAHLLGHRSGIRGLGGDQHRPLRDKGASTTELLALIEKAGISDFEPGSKFAYTNENYFLLGLLIEKLTGKTYQENLSKRITSKIGLNDTYAASSNVDPARNESYSYRYNLDWEQESEIHWSLFFGAGGIVSTPYDLVKFITTLFEGKIVSKQSLGLMTAMKDDYGFGMDVVQLGGKTYFGHTGGAQSYGAWLAYLPEEKLALAYATNAKPYPVKNIVGGIFDIYWNRPFEIPLFATFDVGPEVLDCYVGVYSATGVPVTYTFTREGATLFVQLPGGTPLRLEATAADKFKIDPPGIFFEFDAAKGQVTWKRGQGARVFTKEK